MSDEERLTDLLADWFERRDRGESVAPDDIARDHPDLAGELRSHLEILGVVEQAFPRSPGSEPEPSRRIGEFRLVREIGRGGMGVVYEAEQTTMGRRVALKVLSPSVLGARDAVRRFQREARAAGQLHHTCIVPVHALGQDRGLWYYAMEFVEGQTLAEVVGAMVDRREDPDADDPPTEAEERLGTTTADGRSFTRLAEAMAGVAEALDVAHQEGIIHRDVKPGNLLLSRDGTLRLVDFGLARLAGEGGSITLTGQLLGTPHYMSPEQASARKIPVDHRTDVYSLGATLYEVLTLRTPFAGDSLQEICSQIMEKDPRPPRKVDARVPRDLETIVLKALEKIPDRRYETAGEMARDLRRFAEGVPIRARRIGVVGRTWRRVKRNKVRTALIAVVVLLAVLGTGLALWAAREAERRLELEYAALCARAEEAFPRSADAARGCAHGQEMPYGDTARDLFARAIELRPDRPEAYVGRSMVPGSTLEQRLADLDEARARELPDGTWHLARAHVLLLAGKRTRAAEERRKASGSGTPLEFYLRARLAEAAGRRRVARRLLDQAIESADAGSAVRYLALRQRAHLRKRRGDHAGALADLHAVKALGDDTVENRVQVADLLRRMGGDREADAALRAALRKVGLEGSAASYARYLKACRVVREYAWHETGSEEACEAFPDSGDLLRERAVALKRVGRYDEALQWCDRALALDDEDAAAHALRGHVLRLLGRPEEARAAFGTACELESSRAEFHRSLGILESWAGRDDEALRALDRALELDPRSAATQTERSVVLERLGRTEDALAAAEEAIRAEPGAVHAHERQWGLLRKLGREAEAREARTTVAESGHEGHAGYLLRGLALRGLGRGEEALAAFEEAARRHPGDPDLLVEVALTLSGLGREDEALAAYDTILATAPVHRALEGRCSILRSRKKLDASLADARLAVELDPCCAVGHLHVGTSLMWMGRLDEALAAFDEAIRIDPLYAAPWCNRGLVLKQQGKHDEAEGSFRRGIKIEPHEAEIHSCLGALLNDRLRRFDEALAAFDRAIELAPGKAAYHNNRGNALTKLGRHDEAIVSYRRGCDLAPRDARFWCGLGDSFGRAGKYGEAHTVWSTVIELAPEKAHAWLWRGISLIHLGREAEAIDDLRKAVELAPGHFLARQELGLTLYDLGRHEEALDAILTSLRIEPGSLKSLMMRALLLVKLKRHKGAIRAYRKILEVHPDHHEAHLSLGLTLHTLGRLEPARKAFTEALRLREADADARWFRARCLRGLQRFEEALEDLSRLRRIKPGEAKYAAEEAFVLALLGRFDEVREVLETARKLAPESRRVLARRVRTLLLMGRFDEANEAAADLVREDDLAEGAPLRVRCLRARDRPVPARAAARAALALLQRSGRLAGANRLTVAYLRAAAGEETEALEALEACDVPWTADRACDRARVHAVLGDADEALRWLERAVERGLRRPAGAAKDPDLELLDGNARYAELRGAITRPR